MYQIKKKIEDVFLNILLKKDFQNVEITEIQKKARISSKNRKICHPHKEMQKKCCQKLSKSA